MEDHYIFAILAHDALIRGRLEDARVALFGLASMDLPAGSPEAWDALHAPMRSAAKRGVNAVDLPATAQAMAEVGAACGGCHNATGKGPLYPAPAAPDAAMQTHQWATERLWEGLTGPWDHAWGRGSKALATSVVVQQTPSPEVEALAEGMRAAGTTAVEATTLEGKAEAYATVLASCAACHATAGVAFPPPDKP